MLSLHKSVSLPTCTLLIVWQASAKASACWATVHTMAELKLSGNHLKGSRPVLSFHKVRPPLVLSCPRVCVFAASPDQRGTNLPRPHPSSAQKDDPHAVEVTQLFVFSLRRCSKHKSDLGTSGWVISVHNHI